MEIFKKRLIKLFKVILFFLFCAGGTGVIHYFRLNNPIAMVISGVITIGALLIWIQQLVKNNN